MILKWSCCAERQRHSCYSSSTSIQQHIRMLASETELKTEKNERTLELDEIIELKFGIEMNLSTNGAPHTEAETRQRCHFNKPNHTMCSGSGCVRCAFLINWIQNYWMKFCFVPVGFGTLQLTCVPRDFWLKTHVFYATFHSPFQSQSLTTCQNQCEYTTWKKHTKAVTASSLPIVIHLHIPFAHGQRASFRCSTVHYVVIDHIINGFILQSPQLSLALGPMLFCKCICRRPHAHQPNQIDK